ncbi:uncharacterized protein Z518_10092 [Rhinocladiella mackenziei CBS 650.93]|uniref:Rhinocladiella mackenziei CBS 650.93 unplaced genomic scaffold supercont1.8, whole genome shotgun sequence n=1 Tax=Rhinocladiella mackenziei CBS 650.93 TaxID=1442369 RepID=A0A0D2ICS4_9EURO|nr:uncharacterized protein Z518_10092 [Rhinocladiella mackenziei CBS 650.93]KIX01026.1 hypothetical protein Z518_10092 [Rhinocladiella mackenziei CBS 650.93]
MGRSAHSRNLLPSAPLFLIALGLHQPLIKEDGMIHHDLFKKDRNFVIVITCMLVESTVFIVHTPTSTVVAIASGLIISARSLGGSFVQSSTSAYPGAGRE